jgi:hypothetical protein
MGTTFRATLVWMGAILLLLPFAFVLAGPVVGLLVAVAAFVGLLALFERRLLPDGHEGLNLWGGLAAAGGAFAIGLALPALLTAFRMTTVEGIAPDEAGPHAAADVFVFREGRIRADLAGHAVDADGREYAAAPFVGPGWDADQPARVWVVAVRDRSGLAAPADWDAATRIGVRLPTRLVGGAMDALRDATADGTVDADPEPILVEWVAAPPMATALAAMQMPLLLAVLLVVLWAAAFRFTR